MEAMYAVITAAGSWQVASVHATREEAKRFAGYLDEAVVVKWEIIP